MKRSVFTILVALLFSASLFAQLSGPKNIPGDYATIAAAIADLNALGVGPGGVTFNIAADYTETFATSATGIITATGTVANPIVFQKSGIGNNPLITAGVGTSIGTGSNPYDGIIVITGGDYITFDGIDLTENAVNLDPTTKMEAGYALLKTSKVAPVNGCQYVTIKNCTITLSKYATGTTNTTTGIYSGNHVSTDQVNITFTESSDAVNNCKFFGITISNVTYGMRILGGNVAINIYDQNNEIGVEGPITVTDFNYYAINARYQRNLKVANSTIFTNALPVSALYGLYVQNTFGCDVYNNTVTLQPSPPATGNYTYSLNGIYVNAGDAGDVGNVYGNVVENCTTPETTSYVSFSGIINSTSVETMNMHSNIVRNNIISGTGGFTGIDNGNVQNLSFYDNEVSNNTKNGTGGGFTCIQIRGTNNVDAHNNLVYSNYNTTSASPTQGGTIYGINIGNGNPVNIYNNEVYDLVAMGGGVSVGNFGIYVSNATTANIYNNYVSDLQTPAAPTNPTSTTNVLAGISMTTQPKAVNIFYNTVYLKATSIGANFFTAAVVATPSPVVDLRNNILVNVSTPNGEGVSAAYRRQSPILDNYSMLSNANVLWAGDVEDDSHTVFYHPALSAEPPIEAKSFTFEEFQAFVGPVRDAGSFRHHPPFINTADTPYDLHLIDGLPTQCESGGLQITNPIVITTDFDDDLRSSAPDIGADEFNGLPIGVVNPGGLAAANVSSHQIDVEFMPNPANNNVVIVWNTTGVFTSPSGTPPVVGEAFAEGIVLYNGTTSPISHTGLTGATFYYYKAFSFDGTSYSLGVVTGSSTDIAPPSDFTATTVSAIQIDLTWSLNPFNNDVIIATNMVDEFGQPVNGTAYLAGDMLPTAGTVIYVGPLSAFNHVDLEPNIVNYYYKAWSVDPDNDNVYSPEGVTDNAATFCSSATIPFHESFEYDGQIGCGTILDVNDNFDTWFANYGFARTGFYSMRINGGSFSSPKDDWYFTNGLVLTEGSSYEVKFWYRTQNLNGARHQLEVKWGNANNVEGMTSSPIYYTNELTPITSYSQQISCTVFSPSETGVFYVGWHNFTPVGPGHGLFLDDITITELILPEPPAMLTATADLSTINLAYNLNAAGNEVIIATNTTPVFDQPANGTTYQVGNVIGDNGTIIYKGTMTEFSHTGLSPLTTYYYKAWSVDAVKLYSTEGITADATTGIYHHICVPTGWGGISSYLTPNVPALETVLSEIDNEMQILISNSGLYWPSQNINTIGNWNTYQGYKIKMNQQACFHVVGEMVENTTFTINAGTSYIPVLCDQPVDAMDFFAQFGNDIVFAYDLYSQQMYWPAGGIYTLGNLEPGVGYLVKMNAQRQATYTCGKSGSFNYVKAEPIAYQSAPWSVTTTGTQHFISIQNSALEGIEKGDFIGVFNSRGECSGFTQFNGQSGNLMIVANGDDVATEALEGLAQDEEMIVKVYNPSRNSEVPVQVSYKETMPNAGSFAEFGQSVIYTMSEGATSVSENLIENISIHPNPGTGLFYLQVPAMDQNLKVQVENGTGQVVYSEIIDGNNAGTNHPINLSDVKPGVYFVRITGTNQSVVKKLIVR